jgi:hypothetical protein
LPSITKGEIFQNIVFIDAKERGRLQMSKISIARWRLLEIYFWILMLNLDTLFLKVFLLSIPSSNGSIGYMVENSIPIPFQQYMTLPLNP